MNGKITANQFYILFFLSSVYYLSTIGSQSLRDNFSDSLISAVLSAGIGFLLALPLLNLHERGINLREGIRRHFKGASGIILGLYGAYFLLSDVVTLSLMESLLAGTVFPTISPLLIGLLAVFVGVYGAVKGIETVARSGLFIFVITLVGSVAIFIGAMPLFRTDNREVLFFGGPGDAAYNTLVIFARSTFLPQMVLLLSYVKEPIKKKCLAWSGGVALMSCTVFIILIHCLGGFAETQLFPVYTLSSVSQLMPIQRMDIVFSAVWLMGLTLRISCDLLAFRTCLKTSHAMKHSWLLLGAAGAAVLVAAQLCKNNDLLGAVSKASVYLGIPAVVLGFGVPIFIRMREGKG